MLLGAFMQILGYSPLKIQCTAILLDRKKFKIWGEGGASAPFLVYTFEYQTMCIHYKV